MSLKNSVTPPGIDPGTVRLVTQRQTDKLTFKNMFYIHCKWLNLYIGRICLKLVILVVCGMASVTDLYCSLED
jgi:hypothetical protein